MANTTPTVTFDTVFEGDGNTIGFTVPSDGIDALTAGQRPHVAVDLNGHTYRHTVAMMGGKHLIGVNSDVRKASGSTRPSNCSSPARSGSERPDSSIAHRRGKRQFVFAIGLGVPCRS